MLQRGISSYQIFSDGMFVFKLTSTYESLTRYEYSTKGSENEVKSTIVFRRISHGDPEIKRLSKMHHVLKRGHTEPLGGTRFDIYALFNQKVLNGTNPQYYGCVGYRLIPRTGVITQPIENYYYADGMYFVCVK